MLWYKDISLVLVKHVRTITVTLLQSLKKLNSETAVFKINLHIFSVKRHFLDVFLSGPPFSNLASGAIWEICF